MTRSPGANPRAQLVQRRWQSDNRHVTSRKEASRRASSNCCSINAAVSCSLRFWTQRKAHIALLSSGLLLTRFLNTLQDAPLLFAISLFSASPRHTVVVRIVAGWMARFACAMLHRDGKPESRTTPTENPRLRSFGGLVSGLLGLAVSDLLRALHSQREAGPATDPSSLGSSHRRLAREARL